MAKKTYLVTGRVHYIVEHCIDANSEEEAREIFELDTAFQECRIIGGDGIEAHLVEELPPSPSKISS